MEKPTLYILCGLPYSGKTTLARALRNKLGWAYVSIDIIRERLGFSWKENEKVTADDWRNIFETSYDDMIARLNEGKSVIYDSTNHDVTSRERLRNHAFDTGFSSKVIFLNIPEATIWERWEENQKTPTRSHISKDLLQQTINSLDPPTKEENVIVYDQSMNLEDWVERYFITK